MKNEFNGYNSYRSDCGRHNLCDEKSDKKAEKRSRHMRVRKRLRGMCGRMFSRQKKEVIALLTQCGNDTIITL